MSSREVQSRSDIGRAQHAFRVRSTPCAVRGLSVTSIALLVTIFAAMIGSAAAQAPDASPQPLWEPGEYIVKYNDQKLSQLRHIIPALAKYSDQDLKDALTDTMAAETTESLGLIRAEAIKANDGEEIDIDAAVDLLDARLADYISPNFIRTGGRTPNDASYYSQWGMNQANDMDIDAPEAWDNVTDDGAKDIIVGVVDTGIDFNHFDLKANMWTNPPEANGRPGIDDDGNGVVDDVYGYNAITGTGVPLDDNGHGSHCAGTIGAVGNNGEGVAGVAWKTKLMALKFLNSSGSGSDVSAIKAINYAVMMQNRNGKLKVLNNSWGGSGYNPALIAAIQAANAAGILFVVAAGNVQANIDTNPFYPAAYDVPNIVAVAAIDRNGAKASFSNYGLTKVALAAPGVQILSTSDEGTMTVLSGTSMAAPHVAGVAALVYSRTPQLYPPDVKAQLMATVKRVPALNGLMAAPGIVNAKNAIADMGNYPPDLAIIPDQTIAPNTLVKTVPLLATDRENDPLQFSATVMIPASQAAAAALDTQFDFTAYQPEFDNFYGVGEKRLISGSGKSYFIYSNGGVYELILPYLYYRGTVDPLYYQDPRLLVAASTVTPSMIATVRVTPGNPAELRIEAAPTTRGRFTVSVSVSDGNRSDTEQFSVTMQKPGSCQ